jgi:ATP-dependent Lhr-like helicase
MLREGRTNFYRHQLQERSLIRDGKQTLYFPWAGDRSMDTIAVWLASRNIRAAREGVALAFEEMSPEEVEDELRRMAAGEPPDAIELAGGVVNKKREKFHPWLGEDVLAVDYAAGVLTMDQAKAVMNRWT